MKLLINDKLIDAVSDLATGARSIHDLLNAAYDSKLIAEDQIVLSIEIDGNNHELEDEKIKGAAFDFSSIGELKISTKRALDVLKESLDGGGESCRNLAEDSKRIAELFRSQKLADANESYSSLITNIEETLGYLFQLQEHILNMAGTVNNDRFDEIWKRFHDVAEETITFQEDSDWVMLADLLEYEFSEIFSDFSEYLAQTQNHLNGE